MGPTAIDLLESRILATLAYAGLFHDGLTESEVSHRLFGPGAESPEAVAAALGRLAGPAGPVRKAGAAYYLAGGSPPVPRLSMALRAERAWAAAVAMLPFVRFIGLTGARAKGAPDADMDLFVVAAPGRGYLVFALLKTVGRWLAAVMGLRLCLNFLVESGDLDLHPRDAFTAVEFVTMVPLVDDGMQDRLWDRNADWIGVLCGSSRPPAPLPPQAGMARAARRAGERVLGGALGARLNRAAYLAKRRRLVRQLGADQFSGGDLVLEPGVFRQHTVSHRTGILDRFARRLAELGLDAGWVTPAP